MEKYIGGGSKEQGGGLPIILALRPQRINTHLRKNSVVAGEVVYTTPASQWQQYLQLKGTRQQWQGLQPQPDQLQGCLRLQHPCTGQQCLQTWQPSGAEVPAIMVRPVVTWATTATLTAEGTKDSKGTSSDNEGSRHTPDRGNEGGKDCVALSEAGKVREDKDSCCSATCWKTKDGPLITNVLNF